MRGVADGVGRTRTVEAYLTIKRRIIELEMLPGASFTEADVAAMLGSSKTPAREALARLRAEGMVEVHPRSGYVVTPVTVKATRELFELRSLLEPAAAARAAERHPDLAHLRELEELCHTSYDPNDRDSVGAFLRANTEFHVTLARCGGNDRLADVLENVLHQLERLFHIGLRLTSRSEEIVHEHTEMLDAILGGDAERARAVTEAQSAASEEMVLRALLSSDAVLSANVAAEL
jgi:DNA-binding GntR family transcriptional regulator